MGVTCWSQSAVAAGLAAISFCLPSVLIGSCWVCQRKTQKCNWQRSCCIRQPQRWLSHLAAFVSLPCTPAGEDLIGPRAYRVVFALVSLPLAALALVYFINHRYSGTPLWNVRGEVGVHELVWVLNFVSFFFLYPSTFNILEVRSCIQPPGGSPASFSCSAAM